MIKTIIIKTMMKQTLKDLAIHCSACKELREEGKWTIWKARRIPGLPLTPQFLKEMLNSLDLNSSCGTEYFTLLDQENAFSWNALFQEERK